MDQVAETIFEFLLKIFVFPELVVVIISIIPIVEARLAIPIGIRYGIHPVSSWLLAFAGSAAIVPLLLLVLIPFIKWLSKTKIFRKIGETIYEKFEKKSESVEKNASDFKKMLGVFLFVAIPLPLTGVWTGSAIASIVGLKLPKATLAVVLGNLVASGIITLLSFFLSAYIDWIILALTVIAVIVVEALIIKIALHKSKPAAETVVSESADESKDKEQ